MSNIINSSYNMRLLDDLSKKETFIHRLHPLIKLLTTVLYLGVVISYGKYELGSLLPLFLYPYIVLLLSELPAWEILKRLLLIEPFIIGIGILNPIIEKQTFALGVISISVGWIALFSIIIKSALTITAVLILIATTGMDKMALALRMLKIPKIFVLQLLLTYRYISVLLEEFWRMLRAYSLRTLEFKGIKRKAWGSFVGQLILRTFDRAQRVYQAMCLRGFNGEYNTGEDISIKVIDFVYLIAWVVFFTVVKIYNIPMLIGSLFLGVIN